MPVDTSQFLSCSYGTAAFMLESYSYKEEAVVKQGADGGNSPRIGAGFFYGFEVGVFCRQFCNLLGKEIATLVNEIEPRGRYSVTWVGSNFSSGVYFYKLTSGTSSETKILLLVK